jgi:diadenosine tetraphosphate (Ap4A) HIT family hydrolase
MSFILHEQLERDLIFLCKLDLSRLFLLPDSNNPWVILVPEVKNIKEIHQLSSTQQGQLMKEINTLSLILEKEYSPDKLNIAALGNMVPQLHIHIICRYKNDKAWPGAIFGVPHGEDEEKIEYIRKTIQKHL